MHADAPQSTAPGAMALAGLVRDGVLDTELAALLWLLLEVRTPVVVAGEAGSGRAALLAAFRSALPTGTRVLPITADDDFEAMPEAVELGWRRERPSPRPAVDRATASSAVLLAYALGDRDADGPAGPRARIVVRALSMGYGLLATMRGTGLDDVLNTLADASIGTDAQERSRLGIVLALGAQGGAGPARVVAAHYVRPVSRDVHGHVQHLPPAVLATWSPTTGRYDHFAWGVLPELAARAGLRPVELEREQARRATLLARLAAAT